MRNVFTSRKRIAVAAAGAAVVFGGATALAYWTTTGSGSGTSVAGSTVGTVTLHAAVPAGIFPGASVPVTFTADNSGATDLRVGTISFVSVSGTGCNPADFSMAPVLSNTTVLHGASGQAIAGTGTLVYANDPVNDQSSCQGKTLTLTVSSN